MFNPPCNIEAESEADSIGHMTVKCRICQSRSFEASRYPSKKPEAQLFGRVLRCQQCGFAWVENSPKVVRRLYSDSLFRSRIYKDALQIPVQQGREDSEIDAYFMARARHHADLIESGFPGKVEAQADFGAGSCIGLRVSKAPRRLAIDSSVLTKQISEQQGLEYSPRIRGGFFGQFDAIVASHIIEHLSHLNFLGVLADLGKMLRKDGVLVVEVPNYSVLEKTDHDHFPHTLFFTPSTLRDALYKVGFSGGQLHEGVSGRAKIGDKTVPANLVMVVKKP